MNLEKLNNTKNNIIDITEARSLRLLSMVQATSPIKGNIGITTVKLNSSTNGATSGGLTKPKESIKDRTIFSNIEALKVSREGVFAESLRRNGGEKIYVVIGVEESNIGGCSWERSVDLHTAMEAVVDYEIMSHTDSVWLHWVALAIVVVSDCWLVEVAHAPLRCVWS